MNSEPDNNLDMVVCTLFVVIVKFVKTFFLTGDISTSKVKKENFSSDGYQDKADFFSFDLFLFRHSLCS